MTTTVVLTLKQYRKADGSLEGAGHISYFRPGRRGGKGGGGTSGSPHVPAALNILSFIAVHQH